MNLIESAQNLWLADDGQSSTRDIARRAIQLAAVRGELVSDGAEDAIVATLDQIIVTPEMLAEQARVSRGYADADAARQLGDAERSAWLARVESARREVQHEIRSYGSVDSWVPYIERAYGDDGSIIATRMHHERDGWLEWESTEKRVVVTQPTAKQATLLHADTEAEDFVTALPTLSAADAKARYWSLSKSTRNATAIRNLPKAVRRQF